MYSSLAVTPANPGFVAPIEPVRVQRFQQQFEALLLRNYDDAFKLLSNYPEMTHALRRTGYFSTFLYECLNTEQRNYPLANAFCIVLEKMKMETMFTRLCWAVCTFKRPGECGDLRFYTNTLSWLKIDLRNEIHREISLLQTQNANILVGLFKELQDRLSHLR
jgi:hypothetical protein